ncbi:MAG: Ger(x)C family spore germination protein [Syntrophomonadaceae bacterium]
MLKKLLSMTLLISSCFILSGCWDSKDVDRLAFPIVASYDMFQDDPDSMKQLSSGPLEEPRVDVTVVFPNLSAKAANKVTVETVPAPTVGYAREKRGLTAPEFYVTGFNKVILTGEDLARQGLQQPMESLYRFPEVPLNMLLAVVEGRGKDILNLKTDNTDNIATFLYTLLREPDKHNFIPVVTINEFDVNLAPGRNPVVPLIKTGGVNQAFLSGVAVFKKDRLLAKLDIHDTRPLILLRGVPAQGYFPFILEGENLQGSALLRNKRKVKVERQEDVYVFKLEVVLEGIITEYPSEQRIDQKRLKGVENFITAEVENECRQIINTMQKEWKTDCIDISKYALAKWRRELKERVDDEQFISQARIELDVKVKITNYGERR